MLLLLLNTTSMLLLLLNTTRRARAHSGPPSTGATITMDGGVADTARANTRRINTSIRALFKHNAPNLL